MKVAIIVVLILGFGLYIWRDTRQWLRDRAELHEFHERFDHDSRRLIGEFKDRGLDTRIAEQACLAPRSVADLPYCALALQDLAEKLPQ